MTINELVRIAIENGELFDLFSAQNGYLLDNYNQNGYSIFLQNYWTEDFLLEAVKQNINDSNKQEILSQLDYCCSRKILKKEDVSKIL